MRRPSDREARLNVERILDRARHNTDMLRMKARRTGWLVPKGSLPPGSFFETGKYAPVPLLTAEEHEALHGAT